MTFGAAREVKKGRRVRPQDPYKVSVKLERGLQYGSLNAVYVGGVTHPIQYTFAIVVQALLRFMFVRAKIDFGSFDDVMLMPLVSTQTFTFSYWYRNESAGANRTALTRVTVTLNQSTWSSAAGAVTDSLIDTFGVGPTVLSPATAAEQRRLVYVGLEGNGVAPIVASQFYKADDIFVAVKGESAIQVQNRTKGEIALSDETDSIFANPLRGKYYSFNSGRPQILNPGQLTSTQDSVFQYDVTAGSITCGDNPITYSGGTPTVVTPVPFNSIVVQQLKKPPAGTFFNNCNATRYCAAKPGEIVRARVTADITKSLQGWLHVMREKFLAAPTKTFLGLGGATAVDPYNYKLGKSHVFGFEKMCDTAPAATNTAVVVGLEHNLFMSARCNYKPKLGVVSQINITTV